MSVRKKFWATDLGEDRFLELQTSGKWTTYSHTHQCTAYGLSHADFERHYPGDISFEAWVSLLAQTDAAARSVPPEPAFAVGQYVKVPAGYIGVVKEIRHDDAQDPPHVYRVKLDGERKGSWYVAAALRNAVPVVDKVEPQPALRPIEPEIMKPVFEVDQSVRVVDEQLASHGKTIKILEVSTDRNDWPAIYWAGTNCTGRYRYSADQLERVEPAERPAFEGGTVHKSGAMTYMLRNEENEKVQLTIDVEVPGSLVRCLRAEIGDGDPHRFFAKMLEERYRDVLAEKMPLAEAIPERRVVATSQATVPEAWVTSKGVWVAVQAHRNGMPVTINMDGTRELIDGVMAGKTYRLELVEES